MHGRLAESEGGGESRFTGVSADTQDELINCLDAVIEDQIMQELNDCTFLSVQVDETTDVSTKEQLSIIVWLDSGSDIVERFLKFVDASTDRTAATLTGVIKGILNQHTGITDNKLIMQTYDGASVMPGHIGGVQTLMRQQYPFAYFVHFAAHRLNLVLSQAASSISHVKVFFANVVILVHFQVAASIEKLSLWPTRLKFLVQVKPGGTIEVVPLISFLEITNNFMIFWRRLMMIHLAGMMIP